MEVAAATVLMEVAAVVVVATSFTSLRATTNGPCHPRAEDLKLRHCEELESTRRPLTLSLRGARRATKQSFFCEVLCF